MKAQESTLPPRSEHVSSDPLHNESNRYRQFRTALQY